MKRLLIGIALGLALGIIIVRFWLHHTATPVTTNVEAPAPKAEEKPNPLQLISEKRAANGIVLGKAAERELPTETEAAGRVIDPTGLITAIADVDTARAALTASDKELDRVKQLFAAEGNASAQALETAESAAARDRAALEAASTKLIAGWIHSPTILSELGQILDELKQGSIIARIDLQPGQSLKPEVKTIRVSLLGAADWIEAEVLGTAAVSDSQLQGPSYLVLLRKHPFPAGVPLRALIQVEGQLEKVLVVPRSAIVYHQGSAWVYVLGEEDTFERKLVHVMRAVDDGLCVTGIESSEPLVINGAQQLLSAELQSGGAKDED